MSDVIEVNNRYYILAGSSLADDRTIVMKDGETFGLFDHYGDIHTYGLGEQGIFHEGTRHLSTFDLRVEDGRPLFLSSAVTPNNDVLIVDLANPDLTTETGVLVPRGTVHLSRTRFLWGATCHERIVLENFGLSVVPLALSLSFAADFVDIFEVRGTARARRGTLYPPQYNAPGEMTLSYDGLDRVQRCTDIIVSADVPVTFDGTRAALTLLLPPQGSTEVIIEIRCLCGGRPEPSPPYTAALTGRAERLDEVLKQEGQMWTTSSAVNQSLARSRADLHLMLTPTPHGLYPYAGVPWFSAPFGRDGIITALQTVWFNPEIARGVLTFLAATQASRTNRATEADPGKIVHEMRRGEMAALGEVPFRQYYGTVDATPLFVMLAGAYYRRTADRALIEALWPSIEAAVLWMDKYGDADQDGFLEYAQKGERGLSHQGWKDSHDAVFHASGRFAEPPIALCEVQGYAFAARHAAAILSTALGDPMRATTLRHQAGVLQDRFDRAFWQPDDGTYAMALDRDKAPCRVRSSNAGHCLFTGIAAEARSAALAATLMADSTFSGWGIRTLDSREVRYNPMSYHNGSVWPHDTAIVGAGLARYGFKRHAADLLEALINLSQAVHLRRLPELICGFRRHRGAPPTAYPVACAPQAWASGSLFLLIEACLGMHIDAPARTITFEQAILPPSIALLRLTNFNVGEASVDLTLQRMGDHVSVTVDRRSGPVDIVVRK